MFLSPLLFLPAWLLLGVVLTVAVARWRPRFERAVAVGVAVGSLLIWLGLRWLLPLALSLPRWSATLPVPPWSWQLDEIAWQLSGLLLLMITAVLLAQWGDEPADAEDESNPTRLWMTVTLFLLALTGLATIWANTLPSLLGGWLLLLGVWLAILVLGSGDRWAERLPKVIWHLLSLFSLWLVGILVTLNGSESLRVGGRTAVTNAILLVAFLQMGVWPVHRWRPRVQTVVLPLAWLLNTVPPLVGVSVLVRLALINEMALDESLGFTAVGLVGYLVGVAMSWRYLTQPEEALRWVAMALAGQTFLIGMWGGVEALLAVAPVLVLATGILFLGVERPLARPRLLWLYGWRAIAPLVALAAIAGLPLTAGFAAHVRLYNGWIAEGSGILLLFAPLLHLLLMTAVYQLIRGTEPEAAVDVAELDEVAWSGRQLLPHVTPLLLGVMLLLNGRWAVLMQLGDFHWLSWVTLLFTIVAAALLSRFLKQEQSIWFNWHEMLPTRLPLRQLRDWMRLLVRTGLQALREAIAILEGEFGLLWLLGLLLLFLLI